MACDTRTLLLKEAETLLRTKGYAAFSYADLSDKISIRKASIHHHFARKEDLGIAVVENYISAYLLDLRHIDEKFEMALDKLKDYAKFFTSALDRRQLPLCGALAAELNALPQSMQRLTQDFFDLQLEWLVRTIRKGIATGEIRPETNVKDSASMLLSVLEGASLIAWTLSDRSIIDQSFEVALSRM